MPVHIYSIPCAPPSVNERDSRRKKNQREALLRAVVAHVKGELDPKKDYNVDITFTGKYRKDGGYGDWIRRDHHNLVKPLVDAVFGALGCDDSRAIRVSATKQHGSRESVRVVITER